LKGHAGFNQRGDEHEVSRVRALKRSNQIRAWPDSRVFPKTGVVSYLGIPLVVKEKVLGVLDFPDTGRASVQRRRDRVSYYSGTPGGYRARQFPTL
jgi:GAF domain-containing protein